ncbi:MAG: hypothetical protein FWF50_01475 [Defluviitaleaceae bacterium]|nr:hypothetical protein [Defluviitaleaceae bacterium]
MGEYNTAEKYKESIIQKIKALKNVNIREWELIKSIIDNSFKREKYRLTKECTLKINEDVLNSIAKTTIHTDLFIKPHQSFL